MFVSIFIKLLESISVLLSENLTEFADYITINISSPNTPNLRDFHETKHLKKVIK